MVTDQGPGIPVNERPRAVQRFYRGEGSRSTPGSGLGLTLVQAVAALHGGALRLEDAEPGLRAVLALSRGMPDVVPASAGRMDALSPASHQTATALPVA